MRQKSSSGNKLNLVNFNKAGAKCIRKNTFKT